MQRTAPIAGRPRSWPWIWAPVAALTAAIYLIVNFAVVKLLPGQHNVYIAQPALWSYLALMAFLFWKYGVTDKPTGAASVAALGALLGLFQIALFLLAGWLLGFGTSPYGHTPGAVLGNAAFVVSQLLGIEMSRACILGSTGKARPMLAVIITSLFFSFLSVSVAQFTSILDGAALFKFSGETLLPTVAQNVLSSVLVLLGGPIASITYRGLLLIFEWLSPILPDLQWIVGAFLGTMAPALGLLLLHGRARETADGAPGTRPQATQSSLAWLILAAITVTLLFFNTGLLGVRPTLISGVSMDPTLRPGDLAITREVEADAVHVGDIIRFQVGRSYVIHRVVEIQSDGIEPLFITRGDANNVDDPPLEARRLEGKVILVVPKAGWISIGVRRLIERFL